MYHLVTQSPWPLIASMGALMLTVGSVMTFHWYKGGPILLLLGLFLIVSMMFVWWSDIISEATYLGYHTEAVLTGLQIGMILFMVSEMMFFFSFFWAFFHSSSSPSMILGSMWPPMGIEILNPLHVPLLNTFILLISGVTVTLSHYSLCVNTSDDYTTSKMSSESIEGQMLSNIVLLGYISLMMTIFLASEFTLWQMFEYYDSLFYMSDSVYGSCFYMTTGFHGFHVFVGTIFLSVALYSMMNAHFLYNHHFGFEAAIWYWHSVDVVWLFLYIFLYCWTAGLLFMK